MSNIAKNMGFSVLQPHDIVSEVAKVSLPNPTEDTRRMGFSDCNRKDKRIQELIKKSSVAYTVDPMIRQAVDKFSEMFKSFDFEGGDKQISYLKRRLTQMTLQTGEHWETLLTRIVNEYFKTGNTFIIKRRGTSPYVKRPLYTGKPYSVIGLSIVTPERLEPFRNNDGEFIGWKLRNASSSEPIELVLDKKVPLKKTAALIKANYTDEPNVFVPGMDIVHIAYKKGADSDYGFGLVLPALEDISMVRTLEQICAVMIKKFSSPIIHHKILRAASPLVGIQHEIDTAYQLYRRMAPDGVLITGGNAEVKAIGSESQALRIEGYLKYFLNRALAGLGVSPFILGLEGGGQGTVEAAVELMMMKVRFCQAEIAREIEMFIINEILWEGGYNPYLNPEDKVKVVFEDIDSDRVIKLETHAADMYSKNMWGWDEARKLSGSRKTVSEEDLFLHKVEIPKLRADAAAKAASRPAPASKNSKEVALDIEGIIPENPEQVNMLLNILERRYNYDSELVHSLKEPVTLLLGDVEALKLFLVEKLTNA